MHENEPTGALTVAEFCEAYSVGRTFFYEELNSGRLSAAKAGAKTLILKSEAARWARSLPALKPKSALQRIRSRAAANTGAASGVLES